MAKRHRANTTLRRALKPQSSLRALVLDGLGAVEKGHRDYFDSSLKSSFSDSLELDKAMRLGHEQENRWDYLIGHAQSNNIIGVEPHSAKDDEVLRIVNKRLAALEQLRDHLVDGVHVSKWLWVASGKVRFADTEKVRRILDQNGIQFVGTKIESRHLMIDGSAKLKFQKRTRKTR